LNETLKNAARSQAGGRTGRLRGSLVVAEMALSVMLACAAALLVRSFLALEDVAPGFEPRNVLVMQTTAPLPPERMHAFFADLLKDVATLPGVEAAGATSSPPGHFESGSAYWIDRIPEKIDGSGTPAAVSIAAPGTLRALGIPLKAGRDFNDGDTVDASPVAIVNESVVRKSFSSGGALGHSIFCPFDSLNPQLLKIVGVAGDVRQFGPDRPPEPECILPYQQHGYNNSTLRVVVRTSARPENLPENLEATLRRLVRRRSPEVSVSFTTMEASLAQGVAAPRFRAWLLGIFAALALALAIAGVYGVTAFVAGQRAGEIGLRTTLGATPAQVAALLLRQASAFAGAGLLLGLAGALAASRLLASMLFAVKPTDGPTFAAVAVVLGAVTLLASYLPARRAAKADPLVSLRRD
jgi:putative ABC transport system permease protein